MSRTLKLLHSPNDIQNCSTKLGFRPPTFLASTTYTVVVIFNILYNDTIVYVTFDWHLLMSSISKFGLKNERL